MKKKFLLLLSSIFTPVFILLICEVCTHGAKYLYETFIREEIVYPEDSIAYKELPDPKSHLLVERRTLKGEVVWDATYRIVKDTGLRIPVKRKLNRQKTHGRHLNIYGGSFTFGVNLNDPETIAGHFKSALGDGVLVNNFGMPGGGPHNILKLQDTFGESFSSHTPGNSYYFFIDDHIPRSIVDMHHIGDFKESAYYSVDSNGEVVYSGLFKDAKPLMSTFLSLSSKSLFLRKIGFNPPLGRIVDASSKQAEFTCKLLNGIRKRSLKSFPKTNFKVVFLPNSGVSFFLLAGCLQNEGISVVNLTELFKDRDGDPLEFWNEYFFPDHHPRGIYYEEVVDKLTELDSLK